MEGQFTREKINCLLGQLIFSLKNDEILFPPHTSMKINFKWINNVKIKGSSLKCWKTQGNIFKVLRKSFVNKAEGVQPIEEDIN